MKLVSWNVNGLRSILGKGLTDYLRAEEPDVVCLQEIKARPEQVDHGFGDFEVCWNPAERAGYSGTAILFRTPPLRCWNGIGHPAHDSEGRVMTAEFQDFFLVNVYTPNSGRELARLGYRIREWTPAFVSFLEGLQKRKPVVFCGDMNVAHQEIDLARPKENVRNAGFTPEEREAFQCVLDAGFVDAFREFEGGGGHYTWWSYQNKARERNIGWRIDYFCVSRPFSGALRTAFIRPDVGGSDHCPVGITLWGE